MSGIASYRSSRPCLGESGRKGDYSLYQYRPKYKRQIRPSSGARHIDFHRSGLEASASPCSSVFSIQPGRSGRDIEAMSRPYASCLTIAVPKKPTFSARMPIPSSARALCARSAFHERCLDACQNILVIDWYRKELKRKSRISVA